MNSSETRKHIRDLNRSLNVAGVAVACLVLGLTYAVVLRPVIADCARLAALEEATLKFLGTTDEISRKTQETKQRSTELEKQMARILAGVPDSSQDSEFLGQIAELIRGTSLKFDDFRPGSTTENGQYRQLEVGLQGIGRYDDICRFLAGLEHIPRLCRVQNLEITTDRDDDKVEGLYPVSMTLVIFFAPPDALQTDAETV